MDMGLKLDGGFYLLMIIILVVVAFFALILLKYAVEDKDKKYMIVHGIIFVTTLVLMFFSYKNFKKDLIREIKRENIISISNYDDDKSIIEIKEQKFIISNNLIRKAHISDKNIIEYSISDLEIVRFQKLYLTPELYESLGY